MAVVGIFYPKYPGYNNVALSRRPLALARGWKPPDSPEIADEIAPLIHSEFVDRGGS